MVFCKKRQIYSPVWVFCGKAIKEGRVKYWGGFRAQSTWVSLVTFVPSSCSKQDKDFLWRACLNILPTQDNLIRRRVMENARCCLCQQETETVLHVLWSCGAAQDVWAGSLGRLQKSCTAQNNFLQLVIGLLVKLSEEEWNLFWITCWLIWH